MGSIAIFGSYIGKEHTLTGEALRVTLLDTGVALMAGLIIFPACFTFDVPLNSGPNLIFVTLPNVFAAIPGGRIWGSLFFIFLLFAALSTVIAVFENLISCWMDLKGWSRRKTVLINLVLILVLSLPCVLGFNLWSGFQPLGAGSTVLDGEDFIVSNLLLPFGSLVYLLFCVTKWGWGFDRYLEEANAGEGIRLPRALKPLLQIVLPILIVLIIVQGLI